MRSPSSDGLKEGPMCNPNTAVEKTGFKLAASAGGATSVLAATGAVVACNAANVEIDEFFGVSGGGIFSYVLSTGITAREALHITMETDFSKYVTFEDGIALAARKGLRRVLKCVPDTSIDVGTNQGYHDWHITGLMGSSKLGDFVRDFGSKRGVNAWPASYTTMATTRDGSAMVFNKDGAFLVDTKGNKTQLSSEPVPVEMAVRSSATIVGVIAAIEYKGMMLFDGGLSRDGLCPVGVMIRHFGYDPKKVIACRVGEDRLSPVSGRLHRLARVLWQVHPDFHWGPETAGVIEYRPHIEHVHSLKFHLTRDEKWLAVLVSFEAATARLALEGLLEGADLARVQSLFDALGYWRDYIPAAKGEKQVLADRAEKVFADHGFY